MIDGSVHKEEMNMSAGCKHTDDRGINILQRDIIILISWDENEREVIWLSREKHCGCARAACLQRNRPSPSCTRLLMAWCTHQWHCREQSCLCSKGGSDGSAPLSFLWFLKWIQGHREGWMFCWHMIRLPPSRMEPGSLPHCAHSTAHALCFCTPEFTTGQLRPPKGGETATETALPWDSTLLCTPGLRAEWGHRWQVTEHWWHFPQRAFGWQWRHTEATSHCVLELTEIDPRRREAFSLQFWSTEFMSCSLGFQRASNSPQGREKNFRLHNHAHSVHWTPAQWSWLTRSFSVCWQTPTTGSCSPFPSQLSFLSLDNQEQARNWTFPVLRSPFLWGIQPRAVLAANWDGQCLPLLCLSPHAHRCSSANWNPFYQNWYSSAWGSGYFSWILERNMPIFVQ